MESTIVFFGASVTQQKEGYVPHFQQLIDTTKYKVIQKGYGSMHLTDAGVSFIDAVIAENPSYCFIDWFSTGLDTQDYIYLSTLLDCIVRKLFNVRSKVCFLLFDLNPMEPTRKIMYSLVKQYAEKYAIDYIDITNNENITDVLRDTVHTTPLGSKLYARKIFDYFTENIEGKELLIPAMPPPTMYDSIRIMDINKTVHKKVSLHGDFTIVGIYQRIGPFSGLVSVQQDDSVSIMNVWDQWCHFERENIKLSTGACKRVVISISQDSFDTSSCKKDIDFLNITKRMELINIFYIGSIEIEDLE